MKPLQFSPQEFPNMEDLQSRYDMGSSPRDQKPIKVEPREVAQQYGHTSPVHNMGSNLNVYRNVALTPSPQYQVPTPSPPLNLPAYHYAPAPQPAPAYSPQHWNIAMDTQQVGVDGAGAMQPLPDVSNMMWSAAEGAGAAQAQADAANLFPTSEVSYTNLLQMDSLRQLNSSDLAGIDLDSFSRLRTDSLEPLPSFHDKNIL